MDFANADIPKSIGTTSLAWDLVSFMDEDFFPPITPQGSTLKIWVVVGLSVDVRFWVVVGLSVEVRFWVVVGFNVEVGSTGGR